MSELWNTYWPMILVAVAIGILVGFFIFRPKQRVTLTREETPVRPHMMASSTPPPAPAQRGDRSDSDGGGEGEGVPAEMAAAASDVVGQVISAPVHENLPGPRGIADDLQRMKGVGPKLAAMLGSLGYSRFEQLATLSPEEVAQLDAQLGAFRGRLIRDRVPEQAAFLAREDEVGYERVFGKL